ncbi:hypothetical protein L195_g064599, partial [Trifolium pratense]
MDLNLLLSLSNNYVARVLRFRQSTGTGYRYAYGTPM